MVEPEDTTARPSGTDGTGTSGEESGHRLAAMPEDWQRALAIVAHPDDLEYGAAAAVAEWTAAGRQVSYVLVTRGEAGIDGIPPQECAPLREREQRASAAVVRAEPVEFLDYRDGVIEEGVALRRDLTAVIRRHRPELVLTINHRETFGGRDMLNSPDHRAVGRAVLDAAGDAGNRWIFPEQLTDEHALRRWDGVRWVAVAASPESTHAQRVSEASVERAVASLTEHRAYLEGLGVDPERYARELIVGAAAEASRDFGGHPCVPFELFPR